jgi:hypothetical protein
MDNDSPEKFNLLIVLPPDEYLNFANLQNRLSYINDTIQTSSEKLKSWEWSVCLKVGEISLSMSFEIYFYCDNSPNGLNYYEKVQDLGNNHGSKEENGRRNGRRTLRLSTMLCKLTWIPR